MDIHLYFAQLMKNDPMLHEKGYEFMKLGEEVELI